MRKQKLGEASSWTEVTAGRAHISALSLSDHKILFNSRESRIMTIVINKYHFVEYLFCVRL